MFVPLILSKCLWGLGKEIYNNEKPTKAQKTQSTRKEKVGGFCISTNRKSSESSDIQARVCITKGVGAMKARVRLVFHCSCCPMAQEGQCSQQQFCIVCVCVA